MKSEAMKQLWTAERITVEISTGAIGRNMSDDARRELAAIEGLPAKVACALQHPKPLDIVMPVFNAVLAAQYFELFEALDLPRDLSVYEPCVGASNPVILAAEAHSDGCANYLTINLNTKLRAQLQAKITHHSSTIRIIEDHAQRALEHVPEKSIDVACFHHAVNDILQTAVSEPRGMDTTAVDWFPTERTMIEWLAEDVRAGRLEQRGKPELMSVISDAVRLVKPGGYLIFDHFNWVKFIGVEWFPWDLFYHFIPMTLGWILESGLPVEEVSLPDVDPQWWLVLRVKN